MRWYFLRHAKTEKFAASGLDYDRSLAERGIMQCEYLSETLKTLPIETIYCSGAKRTRQTQQLACKEINAQVIFQESLYLATQEIWEMFLHEKALDHALFIGHNEGISEVISWLIGDEIRLQTAALVTLDFLGEAPPALGPGTARLVDFVRPNL